MKQRLIDANEIKYEKLIIEKDTPAQKYRKRANIVLKETIEKAPTVKAIPIEWIKNWIKSEPLGVDSLIDPEYTIEALLYWWERENRG